MNLELRPLPALVLLGDTVDVGIYAVASGADEKFTGLDVILSWDKAHLELQEVDNGPHAWSFQFGFVDDSHLDGLNDSLLDGNALFQAASFGDATASAGGMLVATLRFSALTGTELTHIVIEPEFGQYSRTQVLQRGGNNVTGTLGTAGVTIGAASLQAIDMVLPAGRTAEALVRGSITGLSTFSLTVLLEIVPREGVSGTVTFTPTPPVDIVQRGDPWPEGGMFSAFDTDAPAFSDTFNGSVDDDGSFLGDPVTFTGPLTGFGVIASDEAAGVWDLMLTSTSNVGQPVSSSWDFLDTTLIHGTLRIVDPGDRDGDTGIDLREFAGFQVCYTGEPVSPAQPVYPLTPELGCVVYDFDGDGDIDEYDFKQFSDAVSGPVQ